MGKVKTVAHYVTELEDRAPRDFDPEDDGVSKSSDEGSSSQGSDDGLIGTEHYVEVGKSKLRKRGEAPLGPQYAGARVSRKALESDSDSDSDSKEDSGSKYKDVADPQELKGFASLDDADVNGDERDEEFDNDEAFDRSNSEKFKDFKVRGSGTPLETDKTKRKRKAHADFMTETEEKSDEEGLGSEDLSEAMVDDSSAEETEGESGRSKSTEEEGGNEGLQDWDPSSDMGDEMDESGSENDDTKNDRRVDRAELRRIMMEGQKMVVATMSQAAKEDAEKGRAVKQQRSSFDSLLNVRIQLQKGLVAVNSMGVVEKKEVDTSQPYEAAEEAAIKLLNTLDAIRQGFEKSSGHKNAGTKRRYPFDIKTPSSDIWQSLQDAESLAIGNRQATLEKWSAKVRSTTALPISRGKLSNEPSQTIISILQDQLSNPERLLKRVKTPRSCAPLQAKLRIANDPAIYDDADFYQLLLKELIDQRMADASIPAGREASSRVSERPVAQWEAAKAAKARKDVDTRASKGRKLRYTVHEKLQNFMAPEDRASWEQEAVDRFFGSLLGQKLDLGEIDMGDDGVEEDAPLPEEALMLFRR